MNVNNIVYHKSKHLEELQLKPYIPNCPFCNSKNRSFIINIQENPKVSLLKCKKCFASSASRIPTEIALSEYYSDYYIKPHTHNKVTMENIIKFSKYIVNKTKKYINKTNIKILDFGGGDGSIALNISENFLKNGFIKKIEITIVDYNKSVASTKNKNISLYHTDSLTMLNNSKFDLIIASAIIEHIPKPKEILIQLLNLLKKDGVLYARTPYIEPFIRLFSFFKMKMQFTFPAHIHDFGQEFWENIYKEIPEIKIKIFESKPSIVKSVFKKSFFRTLSAYIFKSPWYIFRKYYSFVGGWEIFLKKM